VTNHIDSYKDEAGEWRWRIKIGDDIIADSGEGYTRERDALHGLFAIYFGAYDDSFLELYGKWQNYSGEEQIPDPYVRMAEPPKPVAVTPNFGGEGSTEVTLNQPDQE
jgi:uncharacterized protein YegP (UPF0339 family)